MYEPWHDSLLYQRVLLLVAADQRALDEAGEKRKLLKYFELFA